MKKISIDPASPVPGLMHDETFNGISVRDYFSAKAMQGFMSDPSVRQSWKASAKDAYEMADAMMFEREKDGQTIRRLREEVEALNSDVIEQCRIIGMSAERELALLARIEYLEKLVLKNAEKNS
jgi:predicted RNA-binding protein with PIN domain